MLGRVSFTSYHSAMGMTPFQAVYGRLPPTIPADVCGSTSLAIVETDYGT